ncbi:MAG: hypothetical protein MJZ25_06790 [Fibrobacter sp.]|nr:hypothetical protein [Fibrobacter sp.]
MKKTFILIAISSVAAFFSACGGSYSNHQTVEQMSQPFVCEGLHMKNAKWDFVDDYGMKIHVDGRCHAGRRHGQFNFYSNNEMLAKTKFVKGEEVKTACMIKGKQMRTTLEKCMNIHANEKNRAK